MSFKPLSGRRGSGLARGLSFLIASLIAPMLAAAASLPGSLSWSPPANLPAGKILAYTVLRGPVTQTPEAAARGALYNLVMSLPPTQTSWVDPQTTPGTWVYSVTVTSTDGVTSAVSNPITATIPVPPIIVPNPPVLTLAQRFALTFIRWWQSSSPPPDTRL